MRYRRRSVFKLKLKKQAVYGIVSVILALCAVLILIASVSPQGIILSRVNILVGRYVAWSGFILGIILLLFSLLLSRLKVKMIQMHTVVGMAITWLAILGISRSGLLGDEIWTTLEVFLPGLAVALVLLLTGVLGLTVLLNVPFGELLNRLIDIGAKAGKFLGKLFAFEKSKKKEPVFIKDSLSQGANFPINGQNISKPATDQKPAPGQPLAAPLPKPAGVNGLGTELVENKNDEAIKIWEYPPLSLLSDAAYGKADRGDVNHNADVIEKTLESFGIATKIREVNAGPAVTQYALEIALGTKLSKITALQNDLALALAAPTGQIRIEAPIPGRSLVGIEIPNRAPEFVPIRKILESDTMQNAKSKLTVALGLDVSGRPVVADIGKMPHALVAGSTGSGKSVCINAFITSLLYRNSPSELRFILVDPKRVELSLYNGIPHLLTPVIVDLEKILSALKWALSEMDRRYKLFASAGVRNIDGYNELSGFQALPYIVVIVDELADVMMFAAVEVEDAICRLAQMARATGIHLVVSTQRPSVDVITGLIKANIPCRIAFNVTSMVDSRVIIDMPGAEKLLGRGDMLYIPPDQSKPSRIQGALVSEQEVNRLVGFFKAKGIPVNYTDEVTNMPLSYKGPGALGQSGGGKDEQLVDEAIKVVCQFDRASASLLQRKLSVGYARAARILDQLQEMGIVGPGEGSKPRDVLVRNAEEYFANRIRGEGQTQ